MPDPDSKNELDEQVEQVVLITECRRAVWAWRKSRFRRDTQTGVECTLFRNEASGYASSELIRQACRIADAIWPSERRFTFVDASEVASKNPGYCFKAAGWKLVRDEHGQPMKSKSGKIILELPPPAEGSGQ